MRFVRFLLNMLMFVVVFFTVQTTSILAYGLVAGQSSQDLAIIPVVRTNSTVRVSQLDGYDFMLQDLITNFSKDDAVKFRIRGWFKADWWVRGMRWADYALDGIIGVTKPILVPVAQVDNLSEYRNITWDEFLNNLTERYNKVYPTNAEERLVEDLQRLAEVRYDDIVKYGFLDGIEVLVGDVIVAEEITEFEYAKFAKSAPYAYNELWKVQKYNSPQYNNIALRLLDAEGNIKSETIVLFSIQYISLILSIVFVSMYPIAVIQAKFVGRKNRKKNIVNLD